MEVPSAAYLFLLEANIFRNNSGQKEDVEDGDQLATLKLPVCK